MEEAKKRLAEIRERLKLQAVALVCTLGPEDCAEILRLVDEATAALSRRP